MILRQQHCKLHRSTSKLESLEFGCVLKYIFRMNLTGAHDALIDTKIQMDIVTLGYFLVFINVTTLMQLIEETLERQNNMR